VPRSTEYVKITCRIESIAPIAEARVDWGPDGGGLESIILRDDGVAPDAVEGDGVYAAFLPFQPDKTVVRFRIRATDDSGGTLRTPLSPEVKPFASFEGPFFLYEVDDADPP